MTLEPVTTATHIIKEVRSAIASLEECNPYEALSTLNRLHERVRAEKWGGSTAQLRTAVTNAISDLETDESWQVVLEDLNEADRQFRLSHELPEADNFIERDRIGRLLHRFSTATARDQLDLQLAVTSFGFLLKRNERLYADEFADRIASTYSLEEPRNRAVVNALRRVAASQAGQINSSGEPDSAKPDRATEPTTKEDAWRHEFEEWARGERWVLDRDSFGDYVMQGTREGWQAWRESAERADGREQRLRALLEEVSANFTRDDDLPDDLLPRIVAELEGDEPRDQCCERDCG